MAMIRNFLTALVGAILSISTGNSMAMDYPKKYVMIEIMSANDMREGVLMHKDIQKLNLLLESNNKSESLHFERSHSNPLRYRITLSNLLKIYPEATANNSINSELERNVFVNRARLDFLRKEKLINVLERCFEFDKTGKYRTINGFCSRNEHLPSLIWFLLESGWNVGEMSIIPVLFISPKPVLDNSS